MRYLILALSLLLSTNCYAAGVTRAYSDGVIHAKPTGTALIPIGALTITAQASVDRTVLVNGNTKGSEPDRFDRPTCVQRDDGVWVMVYRAGTHHYLEQANDVVHIRFLKPDGTWTADDTCLDNSAVSGLPSEATPGDALGPSDPTIIKAPNGDLLLHTWDVDYGVSNNGTWQTRSTDGGETWGTWGKIDFVGRSDDAHIFAAEDFFLYNGSIYLIARYFTSASNANNGGLFIKSDDNGVSWNYVSTVLAHTFEGDGCTEYSLEWLGGNRLVSILRDYSNYYTWVTFSDNFGGTWDTPTRIDNGDLGANLYRARTYTDSHLKGRANWQNDPLIINNGFSNSTPGTSLPYRRPGISLSADRCLNLTSVQYVDNQSYDAGYGDLFYDHANNKYGFVVYYGDSAKSDIVQYKFEVQW